MDEEEPPKGTSVLGPNVVEVEFGATTAVERVQPQEVYESVMEALGHYNGNISVPTVLGVLKLVEDAVLRIHKGDVDG